MKKTEQLQAENKRPTMLTYQDSLTGLYNRGTMAAKVGEAVRVNHAGFWREVWNGQAFRWNSSLFH